MPQCDAQARIAELEGQVRGLRETAQEVVRQLRAEWSDELADDVARQFEIAASPADTANALFETENVPPLDWSDVPVNCELPSPAPVESKHVCGARGFAYTGDICPGCYPTSAPVEPLKHTSNEHGDCVRWCKACAQMCRECGSPFPGSHHGDCRVANGMRAAPVESK